MGEIKINTSLAKRDLKRIETAIEELKKAKREYERFIVACGNIYKGMASQRFAEQVRTIKIPRINVQITSLEGAHSMLKSAINAAEETDKKLAGNITGR